MRKRASDQPDETNPEWTVEEFRRARPVLEVLPKETADAIRRMRGQREPQTGRRKAVAKRRSSTAKRRA
jgi:hypothetical protein